MKVSTDCTHCPFVKACPMVEEHQRLPLDDGGLGLCPKLPEMKLLRCRNCLFCHRMNGAIMKYAIENGHPVYTCAAMHYNRIQQDGKIPKATPRDCPIKEAKRKGL
jgi:hypothetical protein